MSRIGRITEHSVNHDRLLTEMAGRIIQNETSRGIGIYPMGEARGLYKRALGFADSAREWKDPPHGDHKTVYIWDRPLKPTKFFAVSQPYGLDTRQLREIVDYCESREIEVSITGESWWFPGWTIEVAYYRKEMFD